MGNSQTIQKANFEDIQYAVSNHDNNLIITTIPYNATQCFISGTTPIQEEEDVINMLITKKKKTVNIFIYGRNTNDDTVITKYKQLTTLGFANLYVYLGGIFEWLLLQDIYGTINFPTTTKELDILRYKPSKAIGIRLLTY